MSHHRIPRTNELLKEEVGKILLREVVFEDAFITITRVETSSDLISSKIFFSVIPESMFDKAFRFFSHHVYEIQHILNKKLRMRPIPKIIFVKEKLTERADKVEQILENIKRKEEKEKD